VASKNQKILSDYASIPYADVCKMKAKTVFDESTDAYLIVVEGWDGYRRLHGCMADVEIRGDKIWVMLDGTEYGLANELLDAGIPKDRIVLGFKPPEVRPRTGFAVA
jgi:hypothetical protein